MKLRPFNSAQALTIWEVLIIVAVLFLVGYLLLPPGHDKGKAPKAQCMSNLKQNALAMIMYAHDNTGVFPWATSNQPPPASLSSVAGYFLMVSSQLTSPKTLTCPDDRKRRVAE